VYQQCVKPRASAFEVGGDCLSRIVAVAGKRQRICCSTALWTNQWLYNHFFDILLSRRHLGKTLVDC
jgi:hypothetical protein